jgi:hypothetical protein
VTRDTVLARLRKICLKLPEVTEGASFSNPAFRAGKRPFVVLDRYKGTDCLFFYVESGLRDELLTRQHFFKAPYDPRGKAICRDLEKIDWTEIKSLVLGSYKAVANKRMLTALNG